MNLCICHMHFDLHIINVNLSVGNQHDAMTSAHFSAKKPHMCLQGTIEPTAAGESTPASGDVRELLHMVKWQ